MVRRISPAGLAFVKAQEGLRLQAYRDTGGVPTIGFGHTTGVKMGQVITEAQASDFLMADLETAESAVERYVKVPLNDNQFAALVSFTFNCGEGALQNSTLLKKLNAGNYAAVPGQLALWVHDNGNVVAGLTRRRKVEADLWNTPSIVAAPQKPPVDAAKTAGVPVNQKAPEPQPAPVSGSKTAIALVIAFLFTAWATAEGWGEHIIAFMQGGAF